MKEHILPLGIRQSAAWNIHSTNSKTPTKESCCCCRRSFHFYPFQLLCLNEPTKFPFHKIHILQLNTFACIYTHKYSFSLSLPLSGGYVPSVQNIHICILCIFLLFKTAQMSVHHGILFVAFSVHCSPLVGKIILHISICV